MTMNLRHFAIKGVTWMAVSQFVRQGIQLGTTLILVRVLQPADFGLMGMAVVIIGFINVFKDLGTSSAIIQKKEISQRLLSSIFWFNVLLGVVVSIAVILMAPLFASLFNEERLVPLVRLFVVSFFAVSLFSIQQALLEKKMNFRRLAVLEMSASLVGAVVGITVAFFGGGVWSLVIQGVSMSLVMCILLWTQTLRWVPSLHFSLSDVNTIRSFSANLTGFTLLNYFLRNADSFIIGRYLGASDLGFYNLAYKVIISPLQNLTAVISRVMYPLYSTIIDDHLRFRTVYLKVAKTIAFFTFPFFILLMVMNHEFVVVFLGEKWIAVSALLLLLSPIGLLQSIDTTTGPIYLAKGRTDVMLQWGLFTGVLSVCVFYFGVRWGINGVAAGYLIATVLWTFHGFKIPLTFIELNVFQFFKSFLRIILTAGMSALVVMIPMKFLPESVGIKGVLIIDVGIFLLSYMAFTYLLNRSQLKDMFLFLQAVREGFQK